MHPLLAFALITSRLSPGLSRSSCAILVGSAVLVAGLSWWLTRNHRRGSQFAGAVAVVHASVMLWIANYATSPDVGSFGDIGFFAPDWIGPSAAFFAAALPLIAWRVATVSRPPRPLVP